LRIAIGTRNKAKTGAVETVANEYFDNIQFEHIEVASGVSEQPFSDEETRQGAINRALNTRAATNADLSFGLEGGVREINGIMHCCNWGAVALKDGTVMSGSGALFILPEEIAVQLRDGKELGAVMDVYTNGQNIRHHAGAIGIFTNGLIDRKEMFEHIVKLLIGQVLFLQRNR
jgi:inosine/xanthosine triphosphatase